MQEQLQELIEAIRSGQRRFMSSEAETKQGIILPILSYLGWNVFDPDEVHPEYPVGRESVDFALKCGEHAKVFVEAKKPSENLEHHEEQLLKYSFREGVELAVLTNGVTWWFYLPTSKGSWEHRRFYTVDIHEQSMDDIKQKFADFLSRDNVSSGKAFVKAEKTYETRRKNLSIDRTLPQAWNGIIGGPDEILMDLIASKTENLCGYRPSPDTVERFIATGLHKITEPTPTAKKRGGKGPARRRKEVKSEYLGRPVSSFALKGIRHKTRSWRDMLLQICEIMLKEQKGQFIRVLNLGGTKRPYFSRNPDDLRSPRKVPGSDIYVEVHLNANRIAKLSKDVLSLFGYKRNDLSIQAG
ncbi:restriction endonuclease subunit R [candidate division TA06 bacterium]|uniref:Restriction endonuclease subunit R n=1 Tax=candidate division TA06 bacterium TaxID=2250710 RepID=A0A523XNQ6_UNCT6|nr:MAG: restriction endonuclease subunit R [candidate division TA06 bacterium]